MDTYGDEAVAATNDDAAICKYQAVSKGYYKDDYLGLFLSTKAKTSTIMKAPEINRGYYARTVSIAYLVEQFIANNPDGQIISLGAGYDSLFWRLKSHYPDTNISYVEIDMNLVTFHKIGSIRRNTKLSSLLKNITFKGERLNSDQYHLISFDLRQVDKECLKNILINECHLIVDKPTLCITECVLVYMPNENSSSLIDWLSRSFNNLTMINYEQCNMGDRFGEIMLENMNARHCDLMGVESCKSLDSQKERFHSKGLIYTKAWTLSEVYKFLLPSEIERIEKLELLDEKELLDQLLQHYCIVVASQKPLDWYSDKQYWFAKTCN